LAAVADHKGIKPEKIDVQVERHTIVGFPWRTSFQVYLDLGKGLTPREHAILSNSARKCEVYKLMTGAVEFSYHTA
jgi:hypothetical protein